jgi:hypothetical protein
MLFKLIRSGVSVVLVASLVACGGGGGSGSSGPTPNASAGGLWSGSLSDGTQVVGIVAETGEFNFVQEDGVEYFGTISTTQTSATANITGVTSKGTTFADGSTSGTGTLTGTVQERVRLAGNSNFRTAAGTNISSSVTLDYDSLYDRDSSLQTIAGNFADFISGEIMSINGGTAFLQDSATNCVINGTVAIIDARYNVYRVEYTYSSCTGQSAVLNGLTFRGLGALDNTSSPEALVITATSLVGTVGYAEIHLLERA